MWCRWAKAVLPLVLSGCLGGAWPGGIGAVLRYTPEDGVLLVTEVPPGGSAARAGMTVGDVVVAIDGAAVERMTRDQVVERLRGQVGTRVVLRVRHGLVARDVTVERAPYHSTAR